MDHPTPQLRLAGAPQCTAADGRALELGAPDALLLAWLIIEGPAPRERMAALLWPDSAADAARNALRQRLFRLRRISGTELVTGTQLLSLAPGIQHDLDGADGLLGSLQLDAGCELHDWLVTERQRRREAQRQRLTQRIAECEQAGEPVAALPLAETLLALDPTREDAHQRLMRLHYLGGDRSAALQAFDRCEQVLKHELGTRPSPDTLALLATIEAAARDVQPSATARRTLPAALMRPPRLVGRDAELAQLRRVLASGGRLLLSGEAGLGKSRLLQALSETDGSGRGGPLVAASRPGDALVPYAVLARLLRALQQRLPQALDAAPPEQLAPLLPELLPAGASISRREPLASAVQAVLRAALAGVGSADSSRSGAPLPGRSRPASASPAAGAMNGISGVVLDDLHFADEATLQLLPELMSGQADTTGGSPQGAWILSLRPPVDDSPQARLVATLASTTPLEPLALQPLGDAALAEMVDSLGLAGVSGEQLAPLLRARSGGNPLFALETLKAAWTDGHSLAAGALPRPRNVGQLIDASLAALSPQALLLARVGAIAGVDFSVELAAHVLGQNPLQLADAWAELEARQVLRGASFAHDLVLESVLAGIPEVLARHAHGTVALWLEARGAGGLPEQQAAAQGASFGTAATQAASFRTGAAQAQNPAFGTGTGTARAAVAGAAQAAAFGTGTAQTSASGAGTARAPVSGRSAAQATAFGTGTGTAQATASGTGMAQATAFGIGAAQAAAFGMQAVEPARVAAHWEAAGQRDRALPGLRAAAARAHAALREPERVAFLLRAADIAEHQGQLDEAFALVAEAIEAHMNTMRDAAGLPLLDRLDRLARTPRQRARAAGHRAWYCSTQGDWANAIAMGHRALSLCEAAEDAEMLATTSQRLGTALAMAGRFDEALPRLRAAEAWVDAHAGSNSAAEFCGNVAAVLDNLGRPAEAERYHQRVIEATRAGDDHSFLATARANLAVSRLNAGDVAGAREQLALAQQLVSSYELQGTSAGFIAALQAQAARAMGCYAEALAWCDSAEAVLASAGPGWLPVVQMHRAQILLDLGQPARAQQTLAAIDSAALPARLQARHGGLWARLQLALGQDASALLDSALAKAPGTGWPELRLGLLIERAALQPAPERIDALFTVAQAALQLGLRGVALAALLRLCGSTDDAAAAQEAAQAALAMEAEVEPNNLYRAERWLGPASAAAAAGDLDAAAALAQAGWHWVLQTAEQQVPEPFRDGFLHRQPVNLALRRLSGLVKA